MKRFLKTAGYIKTAAITSFLLFLAYTPVFAEPIGISDSSQLENISNDLSGDYILTQDIDCSAHGKFTPIGDAANPFLGSLEGGGYEIQNLDLDDPDYAGLFGVIGSTGLVENLTINGVTLDRGSEGVAEAGGGLAGLNLGKIDTVKVIIKSDDFIEAGSSAYSGGLVGRNEGEIYDSIVVLNGQVRSALSTDRIGGFIGHLNGGPVRRCAVIGSGSVVLTSNEYVGGFAAHVGTGLGNDELSDIYVNVHVDASGADDQSRVGGLIGSFNTSKTVGMMYMAGLISLGGEVVYHSTGALIGYSQYTNPDGSGMYWDYESTTVDISDTDEKLTEAKSFSTSEMTYSYDAWDPPGDSAGPYYNWDFDTVWAHDESGEINGGYPVFIRQVETIPPTDFTGTATSTTTIHWSWQHSSTDTIDGFEVRSSTGGIYLSSATLTADTTDYFQSGLTANTSSHYYKIYAVSEAGYSADFSSAPVYPVYTEARVPENLDTAQVYISSATLTWDINDNPPGTRFGISYSTDSNFKVNVSTPVDINDNLTANTTDVKDLTSDTTYYFRAWAYNGNEIMTAFSNTAGTTTLKLGIPPPAPEDFTGIVLSSTSLKWQWELSAGATAYYIYDGSDTLLQTVYEPAQEWTESGLEPNIKYSRWIKAGNEYGVSESSSTDSAYTYAAPPHSLVFDEVNFSSVTVSWSTSTANPAGTRFGISYSTDSTFSAAVTTPTDFNSDLTAGTTDIFNLTHNTTYYFKAYAFNDEGSWPGTDQYSATASTRTRKDPTLISTPGNLILNEFFDFWTEDNADYWTWDGAAGRLQKSPGEPLAGDYNISLTPVGSHDTLINNIGSEFESGKTYRAEIWVKGTSGVRVRAGIRWSGSNQYGPYAELENDRWTKVTHNRQRDVEGTDDGLIISVLESVEGARPEVTVGAAWLGENDPPLSWPAGILYLSPVEVYENESFDRVFTLTLANEQFSESLDAAHLSLSEDFAGLSIDSLNRVNSTTATVSISGSLSYGSGSGKIIVNEDGLDGEEALEASAVVVPVIRAFPHQEGFEHGGDIPPGWRLYGSLYISDTGTHNRTGDYSVAVGAGDNTAHEMESVLFDYSGLTAEDISFWYRGTSTAAGSTITVVASTDGGETYTVPVLDTVSITADSGFYELSADRDLSPLQDESSVKFKWTIFRTGGIISLDDITFSAADIAPAAVSNLEAEALLDGGIELTWTSPQDITGGEYRIRWSTDSAVDWESDWAETEGLWEDEDNRFSLTFATDTLEGGAHSYSVENLDGGVEYFFRMWIKDDAGNWSDISNPSNATVVQITEVNVVTETHYFGQLDLEQSTMTVEAIKVINTGNVPLNYSIKASTITEETPWVFGSEPGWDRFVLMAAFHDSKPTEEEFAVNDNIVGSDYIACSGTVYTIDNTQAGVSIPKGGELDLWIYFIMPRQTTTPQLQEMMITIGAQKDE